MGYAVPPETLLTTEYGCRGSQRVNEVRIVKFTAWGGRQFEFSRKRQMCCPSHKLTATPNPEHI